MNTLRDEVIASIGIAIEGREFLKFKWESEYGNQYDKPTRDSRIKDINKDLSSLRKLRSRIKHRKRL